MQQQSRTPTTRGPAERFTGDVWHRVPGQPVARRSSRQHGDDVRLLKRRSELDLPREPLGGESMNHFGREQLHDDVAAERSFSRNEYATHRSAAQLSAERVGGPQRYLKLLAKCFGHGEREAGNGKGCDTRVKIGSAALARKQAFLARGWRWRAASGEQETPQRSKSLRGFLLVKWA